MFSLQCITIDYPGAITYRDTIHLQRCFQNIPLSPFIPSPAVR